MSIYASLHATETRHSEDCAIWVPDGEHDGCVMEGPDDLCTCGLRAAPIVFRGSQFLPSDEDQRGGWVDLAAIPGHIEREGRPPTNPDDETFPYHPWLRFGVNGETVVLDRAGVERVHLTLTEWMNLL